MAPLKVMIIRHAKSRSAMREAWVQRAFLTIDVVLVAWEHKEISRLIEFIAEHSLEAPIWPDDRFDLVVILDRLVGGWCMIQSPQLLLSCDRDEPLEARNDFSPVRRFDPRLGIAR